MLRRRRRRRCLPHSVHAWPPSPSARASAGGSGVVVRLPDMRTGVPDVVPSAGRPPDKSPQAAAGDDQGETAGSHVRSVWAGLLHGPGPWRPHEEAPRWARCWLCCGPYMGRHATWEAQFDGPIAAARLVRLIRINHTSLSISLKKQFQKTNNHTARHRSSWPSLFFG